MALQLNTNSQTNNKKKSEIFIKEDSEKWMRKNQVKQVKTKSFQTLGAK